ncbi:MAG: hypothetical protein MZV49_05710 [Rhodopseudomonas palustris]|nr:hypothetical protein [Rhodopseudomonas palustris]
MTIISRRPSPTAVVAFAALTSKPPTAMIALPLVFGAVRRPIRALGRIRRGLRRPRRSLVPGRHNVTGADPAVPTMI